MKQKKHFIDPSRHKIVFNKEEQLHVILETDRLCIGSITPTHEKDCLALFANADTMRKFAKGVPYEEAQTKRRLNRWLTDWKNHQPFTGYAIHLKDSSEFMGVIMLEPAGPGEAEISYVFNPLYWGKGYGTEAADAVFQSLIPRLMFREYLVENRPLRQLVATARLDNVASQHVLKGVGFVEKEVVKKFGASRYSYGLFAKNVRNEYHHFFDKRDRNRQQEEDWAMVSQDLSTLELVMSDFGGAWRTGRR